MRPTLELIVEPGRYAVARGALPEPPAEEGAASTLRAEIRAGGEVSAICPELELAESTEAERGWRWLRVRGPLPFTEVGILAAIATPLAEVRVPIFVVSTFETDHVLIPEVHLETATAALRSSGITVTMQ